MLRSSRRHLRLSLAALLLIIPFSLAVYFHAQAAPGPLCYVNANVVGGADNGSSWANAYDDLQEAIDDLNCDEVWVAQGTYVPSQQVTGNARDLSFSFFSTSVGREFYGGFDGSETIRDQRDWQANPTVLDGDLNGDDGANFSNYADNVLHVIQIYSVSRTFVLDGFVVRGGSADDESVSGGTYGGGLAVGDADPTLRNLVVRENRALDDGLGSGNGGGLYVGTGGNPAVSGVSFIDNYAETFGGGLYIERNGVASVTSSTFESNEAGLGGSAMDVYGGSLDVENVTITGNTAAYAVEAWRAGLIDINNATFEGNDNAIKVRQLITENPTILINNSILYANGTTLQVALGGYVEFVDSIVEGGCPGSASKCTNLIDADPLLDALADNGGETETMALGNGSPAIDAGGVNAACATEDQRGASRPQDGDGDGTAACDMGAYEAKGIATSSSSSSGSSGEKAGQLLTFGLNTIDSGRVHILIEASAIPTGYRNCRLETEVVGDSEEYNFQLADTVWDIRLTCDGVRITSLRQPITVCIKPADGVTGDKHIFHRHSSAFSQLPDIAAANGYVCGTTSQLSLFTLGADTLPATGFAPGAVTAIGEQPPSLAYAGTDLTLSIPKLGIAAPILGIPKADGGWNVSWLSDSVGYLEGTAFPTLPGNTVLTAHVWNADNSPVLFARLDKLAYGDRFTIEAFGHTYTYEVRSNALYSPVSNAPLVHEDYDWVTLITCHDYDPDTGLYTYRRAVRAVLVGVE